MLSSTTPLQSLEAKRSLIMNLLSKEYSQEKILVELQQEFACKNYVKQHLIQNMDLQQPNSTVKFDGRQ